MTQGRASIRYVDIGSVDGATHQLTEVAKIPAATAPTRARQVIAAGDTVFSTVRPYLEKIAFIDDTLDGEFASTGFCVLRPTAAVLPRWLFYFATSPALLDQLLPLQRGVSYPAVVDKDVRACLIPVPPIEEQQRIVDILEDHLSRLDAACGWLERTPGRLSAFTEATTTRWLRGAPRKSLSALLEQPLSNGRSVPTADEGFPVLRLTSLRHGRLDIRERKIGAWTAAEAAPFLVHRDDFMVARGSGSLALVGAGGLVEDDPDPVAFPDTMIRVRVRADRLLPGLLAAIWSTREVRRQIEGAARTTAGIYKINQKDLGSVVLPAPGIETQAALLRALDEARDTVQGARSSLELATARSVSLRRSLLSAAFSGRLTGADPVLEPQEVVSA